MEANIVTAPPSRAAATTSSAEPVSPPKATSVDRGSNSDLLARLRSPGVIAGAVLAGVVFAAYFTELLALAHRWANEADYSHGFAVPLFSAYLLWHRRGMLKDQPLVGSWLGLPLLLSAGAIMAAAVYLSFRLLEPFSILPCLAGLALLLGGWRCLHWCWPAIGFLIFAIPLPGAVAGMLSHPLQRIATIASVYSLQTVGVPAVPQGNIIWLTEGNIGVEEACNGIRMLMVFFAISVGMAFVVRRPLWEKLLIAASAPFLAILANIGRITATGVLHETAGREWADWIFHDVAGFLMMPLGMALLAVELWILKQLWDDTPTESPHFAAASTRDRANPAPQPAPRTARKRRRKAR